MVREINRNTFLLSQKSVPATPMDAQVITDLVDTLRANLDRCVGMAANMIGVNKRIIAVCIGPACLPMINPVILKKSGPVYSTEEGCLSLDGVRPVTRHETIELEYLDPTFTKHRATFSGFTAQIIQHELDHCEGILI